MFIDTHSPFLGAVFLWTNFTYRLKTNSMTNFAKTYFDENGRLIAEDFNDVYFSIEGGLEETRYVFLNGNHLPQRWQGQEKFTIIETGFGTGLNFLATWQLLEKEAPHLKLHFISVEKFPLMPDTFKMSLAEYPEFTKYKETLNGLYEQLIKKSINTLPITQNIKLTMLIGDVEDALLQAPQKADAWFLDGFTPSKNPEMWQDNLYRNMASLSNPQATFASFTAAGMVRRGLEKAGFEVKRIKGYGHKRHMIQGELKILG
jgi:tRNA 5-methylaminomethyl-2-thiouridine biosynthesis bifunctional protein